MKFIRGFLNRIIAKYFDKDDWQAFEDIPVQLKKLLQLIWCILSFLFVFLIIMVVKRVTSSFIIPGFIFELVLILYSLYLYCHFRAKKYVQIEGVCIDVVIRGYRKQNRDIYFEDNNGKTYMFTVSNAKRKFLRINDRVIIFACSDSSVLEKQGIFIIYQFYTVCNIGKHRSLK